MSTFPVHMALFCESFLYLESHCVTSNMSGPSGQLYLALIPNPLEMVLYQIIELLTCQATLCPCILCTLSGP